MGFFKDHRFKKPTKKEIERVQAEQVRIQEGVQKVNALLDEYGLALSIQQNVVITKRS